MDYSTAGDIYPTVSNAPTIRNAVPQATLADYSGFDDTTRTANGTSRRGSVTRDGTGIVGGLAKRCFDITAVGILLIGASPFLLFIAALIRLIDGGPVLFRHTRVGYNGRLFSCIKFRTMMNNADEWLARHLEADEVAAREWQDMRKLKCDPRLTVLGSFLRKTSLDELPQLYNILKGDMSLVGPRPIEEAEMHRYGDLIEDYLRSRPGLTGAWQVSGRSDIGYSVRVLIDHDYVQNWSFGKDLKIMVKTFGVVLLRSGAY